MNRPAALAAAFALASLSACVAPPPPPRVVPALRYEAVPPPPRGVRMVWQPGHYQWNGADYMWIPGQYVPARETYHRWVHGHWDGPVWVPAHWD